MILSLEKAFTARALGVAWNNYKQTRASRPFSGRVKFGTRKEDSLGLRFILGESGAPVSLKASNFDAQAPLRDPIGFSEMEKKMPFFRESYMVTEKYEQEYANFVSAENSSLANQLMSKIMLSPMMLIEGARVVPERMIWQLLAPEDGIPKIAVNIDGTSYDIEYTSDNGAAYKSTNYFELMGAEMWSAADTATPLNDLIRIKQEFAKNTGYSLTRFSMNVETFAMLLAAEDTKKQVLGIVAYNGGINLQQTQVFAYLRGYGIEIEVYDKVYVDETGATKYFIPTGVVSAQSAGVYLGDFVFGRTPEERSGNLSIGNLALVETGISVYTYTTPHPINTHCVVSMIGLPTYEGMGSVAVMKVA